MAESIYRSVQQGKPSVMYVVNAMGTEKETNQTYPTSGYQLGFERIWGTGSYTISRILKGREERVFSTKGKEKEKKISRYSWLE